MAGKRIVLACLALLLGAAGLHAQELPACADSSKLGLVFPGSRMAQDVFYAKLDELMESGRGNVNIWHVGGSHVQAATLPNRIRDDIDSLTVRGDRGFLFPVRLTETNTDQSYRIQTTGEWEAPILTRPTSLRRPRYGITGFGARTSSRDASVSFKLNLDGSDRWTCESLRVLGYGSTPRAYPYIICLADTLRFEYEEQTEFPF